MSEMEYREGWGFPRGARKAHYFRETFALCRKYGFYRSTLEQGNDDSPDNCAQCARILKREKAAVIALFQHQGDAL